MYVVVGLELNLNFIFNKTTVIESLNVRNKTYYYKIGRTCSLEKYVEH